jgi:acyl phosphate:glycerol-3-phosphate acyltransferase
MWVLFVPVAYLLGTFPSAHLIARANGIDIHTFGSGNPGASNVTRALGWRKGVWVFVLDALKGALAAGLGLWVDGRPAGYWLGAAAILGHVVPVTRGFRGGKGVATGAGVLAVLHPLLAPVVVGLWWVITRLTGKAAIGSIVAVASVPVGLAVTGVAAWEYAATIGVCALIVVRHLGNIKRLIRARRASTEHRHLAVTRVGCRTVRPARITDDATARTARARAPGRRPTGCCSVPRHQPR